MLQLSEYNDPCIRCSCKRCQRRRWTPKCNAKSALCYRLRAVKRRGARSTENPRVRPTKKRGIVSQVDRLGFGKLIKLGSRKDRSYRAPMFRGQECTGWECNGDYATSSYKARCRQIISSKSASDTKSSYFVSNLFIMVTETPPDVDFPSHNYVRKVLWPNANSQNVVEQVCEQSSVQA